jgi:Xaa-Pro dipeptidase
VDRRKFLAASAALAAARSIPAAADDAPASAPAGHPDLPPSLAALASRAQEAKPITGEERRGRIERARALMNEAKLDALILTPGTSLRYFTAVEWWPSERLFACVVPRAGEPFFVCPFFEEDRAREQIARGPFDGPGADVRTWQENESPFALVAGGLADRKLAAGAIGIDEAAPFVFSDGIGRAAAAAKVVSGTPVTAGCRMVKDAHELALMQLANEVTLAAYEATWRATQPGMTQKDVGALLERAHARLGFAGGASVQTAEYSALPHGSVKAQTISEGTIVMIDGGCEVEGYQSDITRTFVLGKPSAKMSQVFSIVRAAQDAALAAAKPGVPLGAIDAAGRQVIVDAGYGPGFTYFTHRLGHGIGMDGHEWPYLIENNMFGWQTKLAARPGMTFSDEPGIYIRGEFGVRLEDDMVITEDGARLFTPQSESLEKPF